MSGKKGRNTVKLPILQKILDEVNQSPGIRQDLIRTIEDHLDSKNILTFFTSFDQPGGIGDSDAVMIEGILQKQEPSTGLVLIINSPGGDALAAERIINICRMYSNGSFQVIVPKMAKSAATLICLGAEKILMPETAELGPIDPQITLEEGGEFKSFPVYSVMESYTDLMVKAVNTKGRIEPFLQQLTLYDPRLMKQLESIQELAEDIAIQSLKTDMMRNVNKTEIRRRIKPFLDPTKNKSHGRPIYINTLRRCKLKVQEISLQSDLWECILELYLRSNRLLINTYRKLVETKNISYNAR